MEDDNGQRAPRSDLGQSLREARLRAGISQRELARRLSLSAGMISQLEKGQSQPSVATLFAISAELDMSLDALFQTDQENNPPAPNDAGTTHGRSVGVLARQPIADLVQAQDSRPTINMAGGVKWELLTRDQTYPGRFMLITYPPGAASSPDRGLVRHDDLEYFILLKGKLTVRVEFEDVVLKAGDSMCFDATRPHSVENNETVDAEGVWFFYPRP